MCVREQAKRRMLPSIVDTERKKTFAGSRLDEIKIKSSTLHVSHAELEERKSAQFIVMSHQRISSFFFLPLLSTEKISERRKKRRLVDERKIIIDAFHWNLHSSAVSLIE